MKTIKHSEIKWAVKIGKTPTAYFMLSEDSKGPQLYDSRKVALISRGEYGVVKKVKVEEL